MAERWIDRLRGLLFRLSVRSYPVPVMLVLLMAMISVILGGFGAYHCWSISTGVTGTERHKLSEIRRAAVLKVTLLDLCVF